ncbi:MAG TPA: low affinity iron permease family protein [Gemmatimonadaceae bacterium]|nr:low affinity iron permease family protein [Gemmatimonadaceae bacterium]
MQKQPGFRRFAVATSHAVGSSWAFVAAMLVVLLWAVSGPLFHYSDGWQLTINTGTTIITFLMVFLIQHTQNRDAQVTQLKLDELIRAVRSARNELVDMEDLSDEELRRLQHQFELLRSSAEARLKRQPGQPSNETTR